MIINHLQIELFFKIRAKIELLTPCNPSKTVVFFRLNRLIRYNIDFYDPKLTPNYQNSIKKLLILAKILHQTKIELFLKIFCVPRWTKLTQLLIISYLKIELFLKLSKIAFLDFRPSTTQ